MAGITRPLLAETVESLDQVRFPVLATPKLDGIRCLKVNGQILTRKFKPLPNDHIRSTLERILPDGIDGEVMVLATPPKTEHTFFDDEVSAIVDLGQKQATFNEIQSGVMKKAGTPNFIFYAFDYVSGELEKPYTERVDELSKWFNALPVTDQKRIRILEPVVISSPQELSLLETKYLADGFEGVMIRHPQGKYKCGRSTLKEGILLKIKQFVDAEAIVLDFEERLHNTNEQETNELGLSKRSSKKDGLVGADTLGNIKVRDISTGLEFHIGSGFDDKIRKEIWSNRETYRNQIVKYKYQPVGVKELPRFPVFLGFRHSDDMGEPDNA